MLLRAALAFSLFETLVLAGVLWAWADRVAGGRLLAGFLLAIAVWIIGNELPNWFGPGVETLALHLLATAPLTSALFFHFCVVFCRLPLHRGWIVAGYLLGGGAAVVSQVLLPAHFIDHPVVGRLGWAEPTAWITSTSWIILGLAGVATLLYALATSGRADVQARRQIAAVTTSCLWGLACLAGYGIALLGWPIYPFPLLALPLYPVILVYGILRYGVFVANAWAGRALAWTLLLALGAAIVGLMPLALPFESRWLSGLAVAGSVLALVGPVRRFALRLVYPGGEVDARQLAAWRTALAESDTLAELGERATALLGERVGTTVRVTIDGQTPSPAPAPAPFTGHGHRNSRGPAPASLALRRGPRGWTSAWQHWEAAPPGQRRIAEHFAEVLADAASRVEQAQQSAERERERQLQARLAELGALAAVVAHDIRNPLNIISMAMTLAPADARAEVTPQVARIARLASDLLAYAKPWKIVPTPFDLRALADRLSAREAGLRLAADWPATLPVVLDPGRLEQALVNLIENARGASALGGGPAVGELASEPVVELAVERVIESDGGWIRLHVCDNGHGVPAELRERLFEPFASRSPGGTGLGLAIVARIATAHGGRARLSERPPWRTCFTMELPG